MSRRNTVAKVGKHVVTFGGDGRDHLLTPEETARRLAVSISSLNKWRVAGTGPRFVRVGTRVRYHPADLAAYVTENTRRSTSQMSA
jgi:hypothetical protein